MDDSPRPLGDFHVDVVISLFNKAPTINRAIQSVLAQSAQNWRLVIVDDGSSDEWSIECEFDHDKLIVVTQANAGPGAARNRGAATGDAPFIAFLDADDEWEPDFLNRLISVLIADPTLGAASSSWSGDRAQTDINAEFAGRAVHDGRWVFSPDVAPKVFKARLDSMHTSATIVRRTVFERFGGFYEKRSTYGEDSFFWAAVALSVPVYRTVEKLLRFHIDGSTLSVGRTSAYPIPPLMLDWKSFKDRVGARWSPFMPLYLAYYSRTILARSIRQGARRQARDYLRSGALREIGVARRTILAIRIALVRTRLRQLTGRRE